jgi:hypothetical protein
VFIFPSIQKKGVLSPAEIRIEGKKLLLSQINQIIIHSEIRWVRSSESHRTQKEFFILLPFVLMPQIVKIRGRFGWKKHTKPKEEFQ